jgi:hypothetical protein
VEALSGISTKLRRISDGENYFYGKMEYTLTCGGSSVTNSTLLLHLSNIGLVYSAVDNTTALFMAAVVAYSDVAPFAAGVKVDCAIDGTCTQTIPAGVNPENSLQTMRPYIANAVAACPTVEFCSYGQSEAVTAADFCSFGAEFEVKFLTTTQQNWVCVYL